MQRVFRSTLAGLLTVAGLAACGDKVQVTSAPSQTQGTVVHGVTVTPNAISNLPVGSSVTLAASVDADAGVSNRTVTWTSSDNTIATVDAGGKVTGVKVGTVTIIAKSAADNTVSGAAVVQVTQSAGTAVPTVTISSINQTICGGGFGGGCNSVPANLANVAGQLDVVLNVDANGGNIRSINAAILCPRAGTNIVDSLTASQTVSGNVAPIAADQAAAPVTLSFNTAQFNAATGLVALRNGQCTIRTNATSTSGVTSATDNVALTLTNADAVLVTTTTNGNTASDVNGLPWKSGAVTVSVTPVIYSGRSVVNVIATLPGLNAVNGGAGQTQTIAANAGGATTFTFANTTGNTANRVGQVTLVGGYDANGLPLPVVPTVSLIDAAGNDVAGIAVLNPGQAGLRLDNQSPAPPADFQVPLRQAQWVNGSYLFTGVGTNSANFNYMSGGDAGVSNATGIGTPSTFNPPVGPAANAGVSGNTGVDPQTTVKYYYMSSNGYTPISASGTAAVGTTIAGTACDLTGWTQIATAGDIPASTTNTAYVARVVETDKLGNNRCTDLGVAVPAGANIGAGVFVAAKFGVDKVAPTVNYVEPSTNAGAAGANQAVAVGGAVPAFTLALSDDASGISATPLSTQLTRLAVDPNTGAASTVNTAFGCPIGFNANAGACQTATTSSTVAADAGSGIDGYYTFSATAFDIARNTTVVSSRTIVVDRTAPVVLGVQNPAAIVGGQATNFAVSASDNLDLIRSDYSIRFGNTPTGSIPAQFSVRTAGPNIGTAFDNVLTTFAAFNVTVQNTIRDLQTTDVNGAPQANAATGTPNQITVRVYDAANNVGSSAPTAITSTISLAGATNFQAAQANGSQITSFTVTNAAANISNCPAAGCAGNAAPANPTSIVLTAAVVGNETAANLLNNPFSQVQFYFLDGTTNEYTFIGSASGPVVTDNAATTQRTYTYTLASPFTPRFPLGTGPAQIVAIGVNSNGDALATPVNKNIILTNP